MSHLFESCLPAFLQQVGFSPISNPGAIPADTLAALGLVAVREAQLKDALTLAEKTGVTLVEVMSESVSAITELSAQKESLQRLLRDETDRSANLRSQFWMAQDKCRAETLAHADTKAKLKEAEERLAAIEAVMGKKDEPKNSEGEGGAAALH